MFYLSKIFLNCNQHLIPFSGKVLRFEICIKFMFSFLKEFLTSYTLIFQYVPEKYFSVFYTILVLFLMYYIFINILLYF